MKKIIEIGGMSCAHCQAHAEKALNAIDGVKATVSLKKNQAVVQCSREVDDEVFRNALKEAGYEAVAIREKKGLFH